MDDSLEQPSSVAPKADEVPLEDDDQSSGDEDGALDWTKLIPTVARPVMPKRGEKEFEPRANGGTNLQLHILDRARSAMFEALRSVRTISSKGTSYGIWYPKLGRTHVTMARGIHFSTMGHSTPRPIVENGAIKNHKRLELLPEEAIYLIERGALFCWKECNMDLSSLKGFEGFAGVPMSVQQAYTEMIGRENLTLDKFQVYAYLRRLGYVVTRAEAPNDSYPMPPPFDLSKPKTKTSLLCRIFSPIFYILSRARRVFTRNFSWWKPLCLSRWLHHDYASIYCSLRFMPVSHGIILNRPVPTTSVSSTSPYRIFFNVYKPSTPFKKTAPPLPDFQVVVVNARTTPMPTLHELSALFDLLPELPPPLPRPRRQAYGTKPTAPTPVIATSTPKPESPSTFLRRFCPFFVPPPKQSQEFRRRPNPFAALKQGKKIIVIAAVDNGSISFFRFSQGAFAEWPMA